MASASVLAPVAAWRPFLVWVWAGPLEESAIQARVDEVAARGYGGVVIRVGAHLRPAWNSGEAWSLLRFAIARCRHKNLRVWIGDDAPSSTGTPDAGSILRDDNGAARSGSAAGRTTREWPEMRGHILRVGVEDLALASGVAPSLQNWSVPLLGPGLLFSVAVPRVDRRLDFTRALPLLAHPLEKRGDLVARLGRETGSDVRVLSFAGERGGYIDLLNPAAASAFVALSLEPMRDQLAQAWGSVEGLWLQRPSLRAAGAGASTSGQAGHAGGEMFLPWSPGFLEEFRARAGYDLLEWLPALVADQGDNASRVRQDYWRAVAALENEFLRPLQQWASAHGKLYGGSFSHAHPINIGVAHAGDLWPHLSLLDAPTVDAPGLSAGGSALDLHRGLQARLAASAIALRTPPTELAAAPVLAEVGRGAGWGATLGERALVWHHLVRQGATLLVEHAGQQSWRDDAPLSAPSLLHQPWGSACGTWSEYAARVGWAMSRGHSGARVGLLWPTRSAQAHHHPRGHRLSRWVEEDLHATALMLDDLHFEFLFATEEMLLNGAIHAQENARATWKCGAAQHPFEMIVLPSVTAMDRELWTKLEEFVERGGQVVCLGLLPRYSERGRDEAFELRISRATMLTVGDLYDSYAAFEDSGGQSTPLAGYPITRDSVAGGRLSCYQPRLNDSVRDALLRVRKMLKENLAPEFETQAPDILYARRVLRENEELLPPSTTGAQEELESPSPDRADSPAPEEAASPNEDEFSWDRPFDWGESAPGPPQVLGDKQEEPQVLGGLGELEGDDLPAWNEVTVRDKRMEPAPLVGGEVFWVFNAGDSPQRANIRMRPRHLSIPHRLDAWSGMAAPIPTFTRFPEMEGGGLSVSLEMAPGEAVILWTQPVSEKEAERGHIEAATWTVEAFDGKLARGFATEGGAPRTSIRRGERSQRVEGEPVVVPPPLLLPEAWQAGRTGPNVLALEPWQWQRGRHLPGAQKKMFGREQWATLQDNTSPGVEASGIVSFRTRFEAAEVPPELFLPLPSLGVPFDLFLGEELVDVATPGWIDTPPFNETSWNWFDLSPWVQPGENVLTGVADLSERALSEAGAGEGLIARAPTVPRLVGDFGVTRDGALLNPQAMVLSGGSWHEQGLPFYAGSIDLRQWVRSPPEWNRCRVFFELSNCRDAVSLFLNGRHVGTRFCPPYRLDVSRFLLKNASNEVRLRLWSTAHPFFAPRQERLPAGLLGPTRFVAYPILTPMME